MSDFTCEHCGMGVTGLTCAKCNNELVHDHIIKDDGTQVSVAKCPDGCGQIKSPMCCGHDMACEV
jgi:hypothetical protein